MEMEIKPIIMQTDPNMNYNTNYNNSKIKIKINQG